jgi:hypothetical protein
MVKQKNEKQKNFTIDSFSSLINLGVYGLVCV